MMAKLTIHPGKVWQSNDKSFQTNIGNLKICERWKLTLAALPPHCAAAKPLGMMTFRKRQKDKLETQKARP